MNGIKLFKRIFFVLLVTLVCQILSILFSTTEKETYLFVDIKLNSLKSISLNSPVQNIEIQDCEMFTNAPASNNHMFSIENGAASMVWNGYIGTPSITFEPGNYIFEFKSIGTKANNILPKIIVFMVTEKKGRMRSFKILSALTIDEKENKYDNQISIKESTRGNIRIQFCNDGGDKYGGDRNVNIRDIRIIMTK